MPLKDLIQQAMETANYYKNEMQPGIGDGLENEIIKLVKLAYNRGKIDQINETIPDLEKIAKTLKG
jgi:hypothetical protein